MLKPLRPQVGQVVDGRAHAARSIVISSLSAIAAYGFRRGVVGAEPNKTRHETLFDRGVVLSDDDAHAIEYSPIGYAMILLDKFSGGSMHYDYGDVNSAEAVFEGMIEPFFIEDYEKPSKRDLFINIPDWKPQKGDIYALIVAEGVTKWLQVVAVSRADLPSNNGVKYLFNVRDHLNHIDVFKAESSQEISELMQDQAQTP